MGRTFTFGPKQIFEESFFVCDDTFLVIDLFLILAQTLSPDSGLFFLNLLGDEVVQKNGCSVRDELLDHHEQARQVGELFLQAVDGGVRNFS